MLAFRASVMVSKKQFSAITLRDFDWFDGFHLGFVNFLELGSADFEIGSIGFQVSFAGFEIPAESGNPRRSRQPAPWTDNLHPWRGKSLRAGDKTCYFAASRGCWLILTSLSRPNIQTIPTVTTAVSSSVSDSAPVSLMIISLCFWWYRFAFAL